MKYSRFILILTSFLLFDCKAKEGPYRGLLLSNQGPLTVGPNHLVKRFRPQGDQPKELFAPNEGGPVITLPDEQGFFLIGKDTATLVTGTDLYAPVSLPTKERAFVAAVMLKPGQIKTVTQTGLLEEWQWEAPLPDATLQLPTKTNDAPIQVATFSADGTWLVTIEKGNSIAKIWNVQKNQLAGVLNGASEEIVAARFQQNNNTLLLGSLDGSAYLWSFFRDRWSLFQAIPNHPNGVHSVAFSHTTNAIVIGDGIGGVWVWDSSFGFPRLRSKFQNHQVAVESVAFSPDDLTILSCAMDGSVVVKSNPPEMGAQIHPTPFGNSFLATAFSPQGDFMVTTRYTQQDISLWKISEIQDPKNTNPQPKTTFSDAPFGNKAPSATAAFSSDGKWFVTGHENGLARLWNIPFETPLMGPLLMGHTRAIRSVSFSKDTTVVATASLDQNIKLWSRANGQLLSTLTKHTGDITQVAFSADGNYLVSTSKDKSAILWNIHDKNNPQFLSQLNHPAGVNSAAFSPIDSQLVTVADDGKIRLWNIQDPQNPILQPSQFTKYQNFVTPILQVQFTSDGKSLLTAGDTSFVLFWDLATQAWTSSSIQASGGIFNAQLSGNLLMAAGLYTIILQTLPASTDSVLIQLE